MKILNIAGEIGSIDYRMPTVPEAMELLGRMDVEKMANNQEMSNGFLVLSKVMAHMGKFLVKIECKVGQEVITDYEELCTHYESMKILSDIASKLLECAKGLTGESKKKSSKTRS